MNSKQKILNEKFTTAGKKALEWRRVCELLLPEIEREEVWRVCGFPGVYEYAAKKAGMSKNKVRECLRVLKRVESMPALMAVAEKKGINAVKPVACVATEETEEFWAGKAENLSMHALETYVRETRGDESLRAETSVQVSLNIKPELAKRMEQFKKREDMEELLEAFLDNLEEDKPEVSENVTIPAAMKRFVINRTGEKCSFPGCTNPYVELHHARRYSMERRHDPDHIHALCKVHHELAHNGLIGNEERPPWTWYVLERPDLTNHKYFIDQQVQLIRHNATI
ncbi:HNH endonuclease [Patescibacteria group bacterium]|nr:HNH endonuclease [Patescibacteria group bacterium]